MLGCAVNVARMVTGEVAETVDPPASPPQSVPARSAGGKVGGKHRAARLSAARRSGIAREAAAARWR